MQRSNLGLSLRWAMIGGIVALAVVGLNSAIGQRKQMAPVMPTVDGWRATGTISAPGGSATKLDLKITNAEKTDRNFNAKAALVKFEYKGSFASRVARPGDTVTTQLESQVINGAISGGKSRSFAVQFKSAPPKSKAPRVSYVIIVSIGGKQLFGMAAAPTVG